MCETINDSDDVFDSDPSVGEPNKDGPSMNPPDCIILDN